MPAQIILQRCNQPGFTQAIDKAETCHQDFKRDGVVSDGAKGNVLRAHLRRVDICRQAGNLRLQQFNGEKNLADDGTRRAFVCQSVNQQCRKFTLFFTQGHRRFQQGGDGGGEISCALRKKRNLIGAQQAIP